MKLKKLIGGLVVAVALLGVGVGIASACPTGCDVDNDCEWYGCRM